MIDPFYYVNCLLAETTISPSMFFELYTTFQKIFPELSIKANIRPKYCQKNVEKQLNKQQLGKQKCHRCGFRQADLGIEAVGHCFL